MDDERLHMLVVGAVLNEIIKSHIADNRLYIDYQFHDDARGIRIRSSNNLYKIVITIIIFCNGKWSIIVYNYTDTNTVINGTLADGDSIDKIKSILNKHIIRLKMIHRA